MARRRQSEGNVIVRLFRIVIKFLSEVKIELTKVAWPTKDEVVASTWVVIGAVTMAAVWIFFADKVSALLMTALIRLFS